MTRLGSGAQAVTIAEPGWRNPVWLPVAGPSASWALSTIGLFSCHAAARRVHALGMGDLKGAWLRWDHPTMGVWGGVIKRTPTETAAGTMELSADSFHVNLKGVRTPITLQTATGAPGSLALRLVRDSPTDRRLWYDDVQADSGGRALRLDLRGDDLYDTISSLAEQNGHEWDVTVDSDGAISWQFRRHCGEDKTGSVLLAEGLNVVGGSIAPTIDELVNDILAVAEGDDWVTAPKTRVQDPDSVLAYGRAAVTRQYAGSPGLASLVSRARADFDLDAEPAVAVAVTVPENDPILRDVRQGDTVRLWSARQNARYRFRVVSRSVDAGEGVAKLGGDATVEEA